MWTKTNELFLADMILRRKLRFDRVAEQVWETEESCVEKFQALVEEIEAEKSEDAFLRGVSKRVSVSVMSKCDSADRFVGNKRRIPTMQRQTGAIIRAFRQFVHREEDCIVFVAIEEYENENESPFIDAMMLSFPLLFYDMTSLLPSIKLAVPNGLINGLVLARIKQKFTVQISVSPSCCHTHQEVVLQSGGNTQELKKAFRETIMSFRRKTFKV